MSVAYGTPPNARSAKKPAPAQNAAEQVHHNVDLAVALYAGTDSCKDVAKACLMQKGICTEEYWKLAHASRFPEARAYAGLSWQDNYQLACAYGFQAGDASDLAVGLFEHEDDGNLLDQWVNDLLCRHAPLRNVRFTVRRPALKALASDYEVVVWVRNLGRPELPQVDIEIERESVSSAPAAAEHLQPIVDGHRSLLNSRRNMLLQCATDAESALHMDPNPDEMREAWYAEVRDFQNSATDAARQWFALQFAPSALWLWDARADLAPKAEARLRDLLAKSRSGARARG
jgi:hypothetical protein